MNTRPSRVKTLAFLNREEMVTEYIKRNIIIGRASESKIDLTLGQCVI